MSVPKANDQAPYRPTFAITSLLDLGDLQLVEREPPHVSTRQADSNDLQATAGKIEPHVRLRISCGPPYGADAHPHAYPEAGKSLPKLEVVRIGGQAERHGYGDQATDEEEPAQRPGRRGPVPDRDLAISPGNAH